MGRALLAFAPARFVDMVIERGLRQYTPYTTTTPERFRHALSVIRLTRVAICRREYDPHACTAAVPVFGCGGRVVAALEVSMRDGQDLRLMRPPLIVAGRAPHPGAADRHLPAGADDQRRQPVRHAGGAPGRLITPPPHTSLLRDLGVVVGTNLFGTDIKATTTPRSRSRRAAR
jgi:hypothetical protein